MSNPKEPRNPKLKALEVTKRAAILVLRLTAKVPRRVEFLADQANRAACSVPLNLVEGWGRLPGKAQKNHWRIAYASSKEAEVAIEILMESISIDPAKATEARRALDDSRAVIWRLLHPRT